MLFYRASDSGIPETRQRRQGAKGFTMIEVLIALFLLASTAMIFGVVYPCGARARTKAQHYSHALAVAQQQLENSRYTGYNDLAIQGPTDTAVNELPNGNLRFTVSQYAAGIKKIDAIVTWNGHGAVGGTVSATVLVSDHG